MKEDFLDIRKAEGMPNLIDNTIALEFLIMAKSAVNNIANALTESSSIKVREAMNQELQYSLDLHEKIYQLMMKKGWFYPEDIVKQIDLDIKAAQTALEIAELNLFPGDTDRLGMFATPSK